MAYNLCSKWLSHHRWKGLTNKVWTRDRDAAIDSDSGRERESVGNDTSFILTTVSSSLETTAKLVSFLRSHYQYLKIYLFSSWISHGKLYKLVTWERCKLRQQSLTIDWKKRWVFNLSRLWMSISIEILLGTILFIGKIGPNLLLMSSTSCIACYQLQFFNWIPGWDFTARHWTKSSKERKVI